MSTHSIDPEIISETHNAAPLQRYEAPSSNLALTAVFDLETAKKRLIELEGFVKFYMHEGEDFGKIPGTPKPTLYKSGADKLCDIYGIADKYKITNRTEDWSKNLFDYEVECTLVSKRDETLIATGLGSCNSFEGKYRYRESNRKCPSCQKETIRKSKEEWGGGWYCASKQGGCGSKFSKGDASIESQATGRVENDDIPTMKNTFLKMAKKRAKVDAVLSATRSSGIFTQDIEDIKQVEEQEEGKQTGTVAAAQAVAAAKIQQSADTHKTVLLKELGDGNVSLYGDGLSVILISLGEQGKEKLEMTWRGTPHGWVMPMLSSFLLEDECKAQGVGISYVEAQSKPASAQEQPATNAALPLGHGKIQNVEEAKSSKGDTFMKVWQGTNKMQVFDNSQMQLADGTSIALFTLLKTSKGQDAIFRVNKKGNYLNIVGVSQLGRLRWDETGAVIR